MTKRNIAIAISLPFLLVGMLELLMSLPSSSECGTPGIDFMPCVYWDRVVWDFQNGSWIPLIILWLILSLGLMFIINANSKTKWLKQLHQA